MKYYYAKANNGDRSYAYLVPNMKMLAEYLDVMETILDKPQKVLTEKVIATVESYFKFKSLTFVLLFAAFLSLTLLVMIFFYICKLASTSLIFIIDIFKRLKKEMILSNQLLYIIDHEGLEEIYVNNIRMFIVTY